MADALRLAMDYFSADRTEFMRRWLPDREDEVALQTTPASWQAIVDSLNNAVQQKIVTDDREQTNVLVLAGPGAGKTRVLVHRIAYLIRVKREKPGGILALAYNRHAAVQIRRRLNDLIGDDSKGVTVMTCHALAMRLAGVSFIERSERVDDDVFAEILRQAIALLKGDGLETEEEADEQRERLLRGFRWILVDEYQDISSEQYELISALAGRTLEDEERKLSLFAVGDDDQNIYEFAGASVEFIRRFEADYAARPAFLTENYRSTPHIIAAANRVIGCARNRMKAGHPIKVDRARAKAPAGGEWQTLDAVGKGRVQVLPAGTNPMLQAMAVMSELLRLSRLDTGWSWARTAVIAREWKYLEPVRTFCQLNDIPVQMADQETVPYLWRLRETRTLVRWLREGDSELVDTATIRSWLDEKGDGPWWALLREAAGEYEVETAGAELLIDHFVEWLAEWGRDVQRRQRALMLLTAHRAKGLEFDHVAVLDGGWDRRGSSNDADSPRRLYYVAMTRARKTLALARFDRPNPLIDDLHGDSSILFRADAGPAGATTRACTPIQASDIARSRPRLRWPSG